MSTSRFSYRTRNSLIPCSSGIPIQKKAGQNELYVSQLELWLTTFKDRAQVVITQAATPESRPSPTRNAYAATKLWLPVFAGLKSSFEQAHSIYTPGTVTNRSASDHPMEHDDFRRTDRAISRPDLFKRRVLIHLPVWPEDRAERLLKQPLKDELDRDTRERSGETWTTSSTWVTSSPTFRTPSALSVRCRPFPRGLRLRSQCGSPNFGVKF